MWKHCKTCANWCEGMSRLHCLLVEIMLLQQTGKQFNPRFLFFTKLNSLIKNTKQEWQVISRSAFCNENSTIHFCPICSSCSVKYYEFSRNSSCYCLLFLALVDVRVDPQKTEIEQVNTPAILVTVDQWIGQKRSLAIKMFHKNSA